MSRATRTSEPFRNANLFSGHYLDERVDDLDPWDCDDAAADAFDELQRLWGLERDLVESYNEDELLDAWIDEVLDVLGFGALSETTLPDSGGYNDRLLFDSASDRRDAAARKKAGDIEAMYGTAAAVLEAKQWDADFTERFSEARSYRDASHQIKYYLEHTPDSLRWGVLTDGRTWRLYGTKDYATEVYYEVDLPALLDAGDLEAFKYFYVFFRPAAFRETAGTSFLDTVWAESETAAQELGADLQDDVFTALRVLGEGFLETNDLAIDPEDDAALDELKEQSLVLLYRLMFVLYAESRGLIHPDDPDAVDEYEANFGLDQLRLEIHDGIQSGGSLDDYSEHATSMWSRLTDLFRLVDGGEKSLGIPPYNGGLFDDEEHAFLAEHQVADRYVAEVVYRLGTTAADDGSAVLADYADLDTRHLGSIYEGLLEHEFRIAPEAYAAVAEDGGQVWQPATAVTVAAVETVDAGDLYVVNDAGERKATGAYYTPDYVVSHIVEETVDPLLADVDEELRDEGLTPSDREYFARYWQAVLDLTILDPAMGSGHFLTKATRYLTKQVMDVVREQEIQSYDEQDLRREIAKECIYGVDINDMAVELAKLSMWLETLAADQPLAFLDHHLKTGNSLVGSDVTEILSDDTERDDGQLTLSQALARVRQQTLEHVMHLMQDLLAIDNETLEDVKSMAEIHDEIRADPLYQRLFELANVHAAERFGVDVPAGVYEEMAAAIEHEDEWEALREEAWFDAAQSTADEEDFFHWELEYPEVFFGSDGRTATDAGYDAVIGNPPWVIASDASSTDYLTSVYEYQSGQPDLYRFFVERCLSLSSGQFSMITPNTWLSVPAARPLREHVVTEGYLSDVAAVPQSAFEGVDANMIVFTADLDTDHDEIAVRQLDPVGETALKYRVAYDSIREDTFAIPTALGEQRYRSLATKIAFDAVSLGDIGRSTVGYQLYHTDIHTDTQIEDEVYHSDAKTSDTHVSEIRSSSISRYLIDPDPDGFVDVSAEFFRIPPEEFRRDERILVREVTGTDGIICARTNREMLFPKSVISLVVDSESFSPRSITALLNSTLLSFEFLVRGNKSTQDLFPRISGSDLTELSISTEMDTEMSEDLSSVVNEHLDPTDSRYESALECAETRIRESKARLRDLNRSLRDHFGAYSDGQALADVGRTQPPTDSADSVLRQTTEERPSLRVGEATVERESDTTVEIRLTARFKPDDGDGQAQPKSGSRTAGDSEAHDGAHETDQWGYAETSPLPALRITDLTETEADLIEAFVPVAVDEASGFAGFRETATKTNSPVDRLRKLTLPRVADVEEGLASYRETMEHAEELESKIERTDDLIDEIVYELYGLTDEEIEIVEQAVGDG